MNTIYIRATEYLVKYITGAAFLGEGAVLFFANLSRKSARLWSEERYIVRARVCVCTGCQRGKKNNKKKNRDRAKLRPRGREQGEGGDGEWANGWHTHFICFSGWAEKGPTSVGIRTRQHTKRTRASHLY